MARMRACACVGCPAHPGSCPDLSPTRRCDPCEAQAERRRGTRQQRGYTAEHDRLRARWKPKVERCEVDCRNPVCLMPVRRILPGQEWELGHTADRTAWRGPEHQLSNRSEGGRAAHGHGT